jgi:hypothetical protein
MIEDHENIIAELSIEDKRPTFSQEMIALECIITTKDEDIKNIN